VLTDLEGLRLLPFSDSLASRFWKRAVEVLRLLDPQCDSEGTRETRGLVRETLKKAAVEKRTDYSHEMLKEGADVGTLFDTLNAANNKFVSVLVMEIERRRVMQLAERVETGRKGTRGKEKAGGDFEKFAGLCGAPVGPSDLTGSISWDAWDLAGDSYFLLDPAGVLYFLLDPAGDSYFLLDPAGVLYFLLDPAGDSYFLLDPAGVLYFLLDPAGDSYFLLDPAGVLYFSWINRKGQRGWMTRRKERMLFPPWPSKPYKVWSSFVSLGKRAGSFCLKFCLSVRLSRTTRQKMTKRTLQ